MEPVLLLQADCPVALVAPTTLGTEIRASHVTVEIIDITAIFTHFRLPLQLRGLEVSLGPLNPTNLVPLSLFAPAFSTTSPPTSRARLVLDSSTTGENCCSSSEPFPRDWGNDLVDIVIQGTQFFVEGANSFIVVAKASPHAQRHHHHYLCKGLPSCLTVGMTMSRRVSACVSALRLAFPGTWQARERVTLE